MAAGQGFKTFATGDVLTASDVNGYLMQGVLVFASAAARNSAITSPQQGQVAFLKDTNTTTYYNGTAWANLDTTGMVNPMTTTGDTIYSSSGSTPARLGIGTTGQVLTVSGGVPTWAAAGGGSMTQLATGALSGTAVTLSSISQSYKDLRLVVYNTVRSGASGSSMIVIDMNNNTTNNYTQQYLSSGTGNVTGSTNRIDTQVLQEHTNSVDNVVIVNFYNYAQATYRIEYNWIGSNNTGAVVSANLVSGNGYNYGSTKAAITRIDIKCQGDTFASGTYILYGVN